MKQEKNNDEIDLLQLFFRLWKKKALFLCTAIICIVSGSLYNLISTEEYKIKTSFFVTSTNVSGAASNPLMSYAGLLGMSSPSDLSSFIKNILKSKSIQKDIAIKFQKHFELEINQAILNKDLKNSLDHKYAFIIEKLELKQKFSFSVNKDQLFQLVYISHSPTLGEKVLNTFLDQILEYNQNLELTANKNYITIIDPPKSSLYPFKPNLKQIGRAHV